MFSVLSEKPDIYNFIFYKQNTVNLKLQISTSDLQN